MFQASKEAEHWAILEQIQQSSEQSHIHSQISQEGFPPQPTTHPIVTESLTISHINLKQPGALLESLICSIGSLLLDSAPVHLCKSNNLLSVPVALASPVSHVLRKMSSTCCLLTRPRLQVDLMAFPVQRCMAQYSQINLTYTNHLV